MTNVSAIWAPGATALLRFRRLDGTLGQVHPLTVLSDDGRALVGWLPADTPIVGTRLVGGGDPRDVPMDQRFTIERERYPHVWHTSANLRLVEEDRWSSTWWFFSRDWEFQGWYVNLEIPMGRTASTVDRVDGALDVWIEPDRTWAWKDEDEAAECVRVGRLTAEQLGQLRTEGERLIALAEAGRFPFDGTWTDFRPDPDWPAPTLPDGDY